MEVFHFFCMHGSYATVNALAGILPGSTMFRGFGDRLLNEMRQLAPAGTKVTLHYNVGLIFYLHRSNIILIAELIILYRCITSTAR